MRAGKRRPEHLIEAVLLVSPGPISPADLSSATDLSRDELETALGVLTDRYAPETSGIVLRNVAGGYQLTTNPECSGAVERFREEVRPAPLSNAAHEVLASALYLGPLTRGAVSRVRGVNSDAVVRTLLERGLLAEVGTDHDSPRFASPARRHGRVPGGHGQLLQGRLPAPWLPGYAGRALPRARTPDDFGCPARERRRRLVVRLQAFLARAGAFPSRRKAEAPILAGRVTVNGETATLGATVTPEDEVTLDGIPVRLPDTPSTWP